ncbi:sigma-54-dependent Fis family transcriptional regulator [Desulfosporosinus sp. BICA1-9]|uniref:sigma-54-dependent Fis family transcriptional regulator n=1 Tax=Desulfosporosinus sp. BICA1-9 TaxID=1531958 RepID=UPI00054C2698|nr:sigma-54-dependent Fis family transcriptional regulator [Desulfosporosinus sp. BICA1-9]KJS46088.1 MAG: diguanylate cyclase [Peptococcaceae bacterium BRH_c23]KJS88539.1 MAG: diguanylate cyclase [Desulfosporosinus sp. BICA1-9]HBW35134.1 sigma-54-dependent Fis family transcriptional regulator [Desulfosporosinus sp.]
MHIKDIINTDITNLYCGDTLERAILAFKQTKVDALPVVSEERRLIGLFTRTNLYNALLHKASLEDYIDPWITKDVYSVPESIPSAIVEQVIKMSPVGSAPVVDEHTRVVGVVTKTNTVLSLLKKSNLLNAQLTAVLNAMHNGVVAFDASESVSLINKSAEKMLGLSSEKTLGSPSKSVLTGLDLRPVFEQGKAIIGIKYIHGDIHTVVNVMPISDGIAVNGAVAVFHDLTELEQAAKELEIVKNLNRTLDTVLNIIYDGIIVVDECGRITLVNKATTDFLKIRPEEVLNKHVTEIMTNSRLHIVAKSGVPEFSEIQNIDDKQFIVSRLPIVIDGVPSGAVGKIVFPQLPEIQELVKKLNSLQSKVAYYKEELQKSKTSQFELKTIIGTSPPMLYLKEEIQKVSRTNSTVLITGDSGTGKELVAQALHYCSQRRNGPFVSINCAAIPENLLESEMFGYAPGAFSGAQRNGKPGRFEMADKGTLFLDEIGDMSLSLQTKLLRAIQEREFERIGGTKSIRVDVRIIAATNHDLRKSVTSGTFREDLYYRLNVINLHLPPLRERTEDIGLLVTRFIEKFNRILGTDITGFSPEVLDIFSSCSWPGNIRELENVIERAANFVIKGEISLEHLPSYLLKVDSTRNLSRTEKQDAVREVYRDKLNIAEKEIILAILDSTKGNKSEAAKQLGMSRTRLYARLRKLGLA